MTEQRQVRASCVPLIVAIVAIFGLLGAVLEGAWGYALFFLVLAPVSFFYWAGMSSLRAGSGRDTDGTDDSNPR